MPLNSPFSGKTAVSSLGRGHMGGGGGVATGCTRSWDPGPPPWVRGPINKKKVLRSQVQIHTQGPQYAKKLLPPPPHTPKKNHWGIIFGPKMMILQGVRRQKPYVRVCYPNDPKKGGVYDVRACAPSNDLLLRVSFITPYYRPGLEPPSIVKIKKTERKKRKKKQKLWVSKGRPLPCAAIRRCAPAPCRYPRPPKRECRP